MSVIPFDPARRRKAAAPNTSRKNEAQARIALLERALIATLRENAQNWARAERAESRVQELESAIGQLPMAPTSRLPMDSGA